MFKFLQSKKGMTLIELLVVLALLSLGFVAMGNLVKVTYRSFNKAEERYVKQEMVKDVAEYLQKGTNITAANDCYLVEHTDVESIESYEDYAYLYAEFKEFPDEPKKTGYYLYMMDTDTLKTNARCLNSDIPLHIGIEPILNDDFQNQAGVRVKLAALESDFKYTVSNDGKPDEPPLDYVYYELDVAYHFPNMVEEKKVVSVLDENKDEATPAALSDEPETYPTIMLSIDSLYKGDSSEADVSTTTFCFIATASYGADSGEVGLLCDFRDKCLLTNPLGTAFVKAYYKLSPPIADFIAESEPLKAAVRVALKPLVMIATNALDSDLAAQNAPWFIVFMLCGAGSTAMVINLTKKRKRAKE